MPFVTVGQRPVFASDNEILTQIAKADFNALQTVFLPKEIQAQVPAPVNGFARIVQSKFKANEVTVKVSAETPALVVIAQTFSKQSHSTPRGPKTDRLRRSSWGKRTT